jgi:hypothetical protein
MAKPLEGKEKDRREALKTQLMEQARAQGHAMPGWKVRGHTHFTTCRDCHKGLSIHRTTVGWTQATENACPAPGFWSQELHRIMSEEEVEAVLKLLMGDI